MSYRVITNQTFTAENQEYCLLLMENKSSYGARSAFRKWSFIAIREERVADFSIYQSPATFQELAMEVIFNNNQN